MMGELVDLVPPAELKAGDTIWWNRQKLLVTSVIVGTTG
jgi:hypothetical protein